MNKERKEKHADKKRNKNIWVRKKIVNRENQRKKNFCKVRLK